jgi:hypothetical protein
MEDFNIDASVCVGYRYRENEGGDGRYQTFQYVKDAFLSRFDVVSIQPDYFGTDNPPFSRSKAKNNAAAAAKEMDGGAPDRVLVFTDSDLLVPFPQIALAVQAVKDGLADICMGHNGQALYMAGGVLRGNGEGDIFTPMPGAIFAIRRSVFEEMGGWDERMVGWGHEDISFLWAADNIFGFRIMLSNHPHTQPVFKLDYLHSRLHYESAIASAPESEEGRLYQKNSRRRDAYFALERGDKDGYWNLRDTDIE